MTPRYLIAIPIYNHPDTIIQVIEGCLDAVDLSLLIIDDGSTPSVKSLFAKSDLLNHKRIHFIEHKLNLGKGAAIRSAFTWAIKNNFTHLITLDADGQHSPYDICKLVDSSQLHPWSLIIGDREMQGPNIPGSSKFGKKFSNFWIKFETQRSVGDSQSGFRIYPLFQIQNMNFLSSHYDFEIEVITRLLWRGIGVENVPISVKYEPPSKRVTHFNKWKDNLRLTILNSILVTLSLLRASNNKFLNSLALGVGVLVGTTPFYGFHTFIIIIISLISRLNLVLLWVGTQISLPPIIPFLILGTKYIYGQIYGTETQISTFNQAMHQGYQWILSSIILGLLLGFCTTAIAYMFQFFRANSIANTSDKSLNNKLPSSNWSKKSHSHLGIWFVQKLMKMGGIQLAYAFLYLIVPFYFLNPRIRRSTNEYWRTIRPNLSFIQRQKHMFKQLILFAQNLVDRAYQRNSKKYALQIDKDQSMQEFLNFIENSKNKPCILLSTHFGGWELAMTAFNNLGIKKKMLVVMFQEDPSQGHSSTALDSRENFEIMYFNKTQFSIFKIKDYLARGDVVGLMADRPVGRSFELISLFDKLCAIDSTGFRLAEMFQAEVFYLFCIKEGILKYRINIQASNCLKKSQNGNLPEHMKEYAMELEKNIDRYPEQWMNYFPFFSAKPVFEIEATKNQKSAL